MSQLSFSSFAATTNEEDRERDAPAGNPELAPEKSWRYEAEVEYRLPNDAGVFSSSVFYEDIDDYIGRINATIDPDQPLSATGNVGPARRWGLFNEASIRLTRFNLPDAIVSATLGLFDSEIIDPFLNTRQRIGGRGFANIDFRHDVPGAGNFQQRPRPAPETGIMHADPLDRAGRRRGAACYGFSRLRTALCAIWKQTRITCARRWTRRTGSTPITRMGRNAPC